MKFWQKVLVALVVVGVVPILVVSAVSVTRTRDQLTALGVTNIQQRSTSTGSAIDAYLQSRLGDIVLVSKLPDIVKYAQNTGDGGAKASARAALSAAAARSPEYESVAVVDKNGTIAAASLQSDEGTSVKFREYFTTALAGTPYISDPSYSVITLRPALFFSSPVRDDKGQVLAVVRTRVNLNAVWDLVEADAGSVGPGAHGFLVDDYGIRIAVSETKGHRDQADSLIYKPIAPIDPQVATKLAADKRFGTKTPDQLVVDPLPELKTALDAMKTPGSSTAFAYAVGGADQRGVTTRLRSKPWAYVLAIPLAEYTRAADDATANAAITIAIGLVLSLLMAVALTRSLVGPLRRLLHRATQVSTGDVDLREAYFDTQTGDDVIRDVASAFDRMLTALRFYALADDDAARAPVRR
ncbi:MAG TPA: cache and HAMP domain-containing protein [Candidatus Dormibacteraeota bacterium]|jgi:sigma-B regulation protein RsbU (phosphoserine phosphatase)|nr:cache and HAMP domain-containing protein [Candidatus Dormibacteraeota bacterium]